MRAARAVFRDLIGLGRRADARSRRSRSKSEAVVEPSTFLDDVPSFGLSTERAAADDDARVFEYEVLADDPLATGSRWAKAALARTASATASGSKARPATWVLPRVSVSRLERYMKCPFQFYVVERAAGRGAAGGRNIALAARARPLPARAVRDVLPRVAGARTRTHHRRRTSTRPARCSRRLPGRRCDRCRRPKPASSARGCSARRSARASSIACSRWKPSAAPAFASG